MILEIVSIPIHIGFSDSATNRVVTLFYFICNPLVNYYFLLSVLIHSFIFLLCLSLFLISINLWNRTLSNFFMPLWISFLQIWLVWALILGRFAHNRLVLLLPGIAFIIFFSLTLHDELSHFRISSEIRWHPASGGFEVGILPELNRFKLEIVSGYFPPPSNLPRDPTTYLLLQSRPQNAPLPGHLIVGVLLLNSQRRIYQFIPFLVDLIIQWIRIRVLIILFRLIPAGFYLIKYWHHLGSMLFSLLFLLEGSSRNIR